MRLIQRRVLAALGVLAFSASTLMISGTANAVSSSESCGGNLNGSSCGVTYKLYGGASGTMSYRTGTGSGTSYPVSCSGPETSWCSGETTRVYSSGGSVTWTLNIVTGKGCITGYYRGYTYYPSGGC